MAKYLHAFQAPRGRTEGLPVPVSVVVCAHNEEQNLRELVPLLLQQHYGQYEVIVVDDRSHDGSLDYLNQLSGQDERLRVVSVKDRPGHVNGKKYALTLGIKTARYEWVLLTDADCAPQGQYWIEKMSHQFSTGTDIVLGYSPYIKSPGFLNSFIRYEGLVTAIQYMGMALLDKPYMGVGRNLAYRKNTFFENKGFRSHLAVTGGDDDLFVNEVGTYNNTRLAMGMGSLVYSKPKDTWVDYYYQKLRHLSVGKYYKVADKWRLGLYSATMIGFWALAIPAMFYSPWVFVPLGAFLLRMALLVVLAYTASRKLGEAFEVWKVPFLDIIFSIYYLVIGLVALQRNTIRWKKT